ncbi:hypothetical protein SK128_006142 [Halocaridina rubra]|uniref:NACHT domain-containing protein n=1 Tax=Halocaridina rubra TaxID=373956 RepID=A0AAN8WDA1_HALRR
MEKIVSGKQTSVKKSGKKSKGKNVPPVKSGGENTLLCDSANQQESENQKGERDSKLSVTGEHLVGPQFEELSRDKIRLIALKYRFEVLVNPLICSKFSTQAIKPLLLNENFEFILKEDIVVSRHPDNFVHWKDLFCVEGMNNDFANIIILSGVPGIGKTFFTKYLIDWWNNDHELVNFESCKLIFFIDLKGNNFTKFSEYLSHEIKSPTDREVINAELLYTEVMNMPILTILDGYDNPCEKSLQLVKELLHLDGRDRKVLISCRPQYVETIVEHIPDVDRKYVSHISMTSASIDWYIDEFLRLIHYCLPPEKKKNVARWKELEVDYISKLTLMHAVFGDDLCNIRMLTYLTEMYMEAFSI